MFTGITQKTSRVISVRPSGGGLLAAIQKPAGWKIKKGDSISVSGVCSTVIEAGPHLGFFYMPETLSATYFKNFRAGDAVNLERSLALGERLDGHMVLGHVDAVGKISKIEKAGQSKIFTVELSAKDKRGMRLAAVKGSIALDGVSLTIVNIGRDFFSVSLIPYTLIHTNLGKKKPGETVNLEFDVLAKYLAKLIGR